MSSIWWPTETVCVREDQESVYVAVSEKGAELIVEPETGGWRYCGWREGAHLCRTTNDNRGWRPFREPGIQVPEPCASQARRPGNFFASPSVQLPAILDFDI